MNNHTINKFSVDEKVISILEFGRSQIFNRYPKKIECWIAGGSLLKKYMGLPLDDSDIDVYFPNEENFKFFVEFTKSSALGGTVRRSNKNSTLIQVTTSNRANLLIDCVSIFRPSPEESIKQFDFTVCGIAADRNNVYMHSEFIKDVANSELNINNTMYAGSSIFRLSKYMKSYNFDISYDSFVKLIRESSDISNIYLNSGESFIEMLSEIATDRYLAPSAHMSTVHDVLCEKRVSKLIKQYFDDNYFDFSVVEDYVVDNIEFEYLPEYIKSGGLKPISIFKKCLHRIMNKGIYFDKDISSPRRLNKVDDPEKNAERFIKFFTSEFPQDPDIKKYLLLV